MKRLKYISLGASTEDVEVYQDSGDNLADFNPEYLPALGQADNISADKSTVDLFLQGLYDMRDFYKEEEEWLEAVAQFRKDTDNKQGMFFTWGVEYDWNIMFVENVNEQELVDFLAELADGEE